MSRSSITVCRAKLAFLALATVVATAIAPRAEASVVESLYLPGGVGIKYRIKFMPDLDQRRSPSGNTPGLPANGAMYCVPTGAMNLFAYAANNGFPNTPPGPGFWQSNLRYNDATSAIQTLGALMNTSPTGGTGGTGWVNGASVWLSSSPILSWQHKWLQPSYWPTVEKMGAVACSGWIVEFAYGRYTQIGVINGVPLLNRTGGHAVTLTGIEKWGTTRQIQYRDPADDPANATQSAFKNVVANYTNMVVYIRPDEGADFLALVSVLNHPSGDGLYRIVDSFLAVRPLLGITFFPSFGGLPGLVQSIDLSFAGSPSPIGGTLSIPADMDVRALDFHPDFNAALLLTIAPNGTRSMQRLDLFDGALAAFGDGASLDPRSMAVGRRGDIYVSDGDKLYRLNDEGALISSTSNSPPVSALAYDDTLDAVTILSIPQRRIVRFDRTLGNQLSSIIVPQNIPMAGDGSVSVNPETGRAWFFTSASNSLFSVLLNPDSGQIFVESIPLGSCIPSSVIADRGERLWIACDGSVREYAKVNGVWGLDGDSPIQGKPCGKRLGMLTKRSNVVPALHNGPGFVNIHPDTLVPLGMTVLDCDADLNNDGMVNGADLSILLGSWGVVGPGSPLDLDGSGVVNGADISLLLGLWGPCP